MRAKKNYFNLSREHFIFSLIVLMSALFILSGCLSLPGGGYREPDSSGGMSNRVHSGSVYYLDNTSFFRRGNFSIKNERGQVMFRARGSFFSRGTRVTLVGRSGAELFTITKRRSGYKSQYKIYSHGSLVARVYKRRTSRYDKFYVNSRKGRDYTVRGDFMSRLYAFYYRNHQVAQVTKSRRSFSDKYRIEISPQQNDLLILATTVIIDMENSYRRR